MHHQSIDLRVKLILEELDMLDALSYVHNDIGFDSDGFISTDFLRNYILALAEEKNDVENIGKNVEQLEEKIHQLFHLYEAQQDLRERAVLLYNKEQLSDIPLFDRGFASDIKRLLKDEEIKFEKGPALITFDKIMIPIGPCLRVLKIF